MGCGCNKGGRKVFRNTPTPTPPITERGIQPISRQATNDSKCKSCGWAMKRIKYIDVATNSKIDRIQCTNEKCPTRN